MPTLKIHLFGDFRLVYGDQSVVGLEAPRIQSLLAYLVLHRDAPHSRRHLAYLLWPDSSEAQARTNLRKHFHLLRRGLPAADLFLHSDSQTLAWCPLAPFTLDVAEFEQAIACADTLQSLEHAATLYPGDLLPNCYDDWIVPDRESLRTVFHGCLQRLVAEFEEARSYSDALIYAHRLVRQDPLVEEAYRRLMRLHALAGDRAGVIRAYKTCVALLARELSTEPSSETRFAFEHFLMIGD